ncbi:MAG: DUF7948 domain-containing protein [Candidatus Aminicenantales bacterium]
MKRRALVIAGLLAALGCLQASIVGQRGITNFQVPAIVSPQGPRIHTDFGKVPLSFIPNKGQVDGQAVFYVPGKDKTIYFTAEGLTFVLHGQRESTPKRWVVKLDFVGSNPEAVPTSFEESGAVISYFKGKPDAWKTGLSASSRIIYRELWPGIDLMYYGTIDRMKYEFIVHPGADPSMIKLAYRGAESVILTQAGRLAVKTSLGGFEDDVPLAWQRIEKAPTDVPVTYTLESEKGRAGNCTHAFGFNVGEYDKRFPLVLDPAVLVYCGYIGGSGSDEGKAIAVDGSGNAYITGFAYDFEGTFPVTAGPDLTYNGEPSDAFVAKVNADGSGLVYCGYIGGNGWDEGRAIAVDSLGNAYVAGDTSSTDFPVTPGSTLTYNGSIDAFMAKVNADGTDLVYSGHIGGANNENARGIAVDGSGNAYITGETFSGDLPVAVGPDLTYNGGQDAYIAKVTAAGTGLVYCGYIGGWANQEGRAIAVDGSGNAYVTGNSAEDDFPFKIGPGLTSRGMYDAFVAKVNPDGSDLVYAGYIGGLNDDVGLGIAVDGSGNAYITGYTDNSEASFPVTVGPDLTWNGGSSDAFVAKVNADGSSALGYCGYIGGGPSGLGPGNDRGNGIAVDLLGNAYVTGQTDSSEASFPATIGPDLTWNGGNDAFAAKVNIAGTRLIYCGYIGGPEEDVGLGIALDGSGDAYVTGYTFSAETAFPVTIGPDLTYNSGEDAFAARISAYDIFTLEADPTSVTINAGQSATYTIQLTPQSGPIDSAIAFSCTGLPSKCTASFSPASVTPGSSTVTTTLTLRTQASSSAAGASLAGAIGLKPPVIGFSLFILMLLVGSVLHRQAPRHIWRRCLAACALAYLVILIGGCGASDGEGPYTGTPKGSHQISVQGRTGDTSVLTTVALVVK